MKMQHHEGPEQGKIFIEEGGKRVAALVYYKDGNTMNIEHTEVDKSMRGQKLGYALVQEAVEVARDREWKVSPVCPFAKNMFARKPDWNDVLA